MVADGRGGDREKGRMGVGGSGKGNSHMSTISSAVEVTGGKHRVYQLCISVIVPISTADGLLPLHILYR